MADWKMNERARMHGSREVDPGVEQDDEFRQDPSYPTATRTNLTTLGALFQIPISTKQKNPKDSPTTPLGFVCSPGRHLFNGRTQRSNDRTASPTRLSPYARGQSMNGRIQKSRSQSFNAKYGLQSHHMETLQSKLYKKMRTLGVDHQTVVERLERLKDLYISRGDQSGPESPLSSSQQPLLVEDQPAQDSTIALLKYKFAQLERFKESTHGQQIPLYPPQYSHGGQSSASASGHHTPSSSASGSPHLAPGSDSSYEFDETTAALLAVQQEMMWNCPGRSTGTSEVASNSNESIKSLSPNWYTTGGKSPTTTSSTASSSDEATNNVALHYKLPPLKLTRQSNLRAIQQDRKIRGAAIGHTTRSGVCTESTLGSLFSEEKVGSLAESTLFSLFSEEKIESLATITLANKDTDPQKKLASSIEMAMAKLSFSLSRKLSSPKRKVQGAAWGTGLSLTTPVLADHSKERSAGSQIPESWRYNAPVVQSSNDRIECPSDVTMEHQEVIDTSLRL